MSGLEEGRKKTYNRHVWVVLYCHVMLTLWNTGRPFLAKWRGR